MKATPNTKFVSFNYFTFEPDADGLHLTFAFTNKPDVAVEDCGVIRIKNCLEEPLPEIGEIVIEWVNCARYTASSADAPVDAEMTITLTSETFNLFIATSRLASVNDYHVHRIIEGVKTLIDRGRIFIT